MEIFVVDDGSSRPVRVELSDFQHPVHVMVLAENQGCAAARNAGLRKILEGNFDYVALQDAGDTDIGNRMESQAEYLDTHADIAVVGAATRYVDQAGELLYEYNPPETSREIRARMPYNSAFAIRRRCFAYPHWRRSVSMTQALRLPATTNFSLGLPMLSKRRTCQSRSSTKKITLVACHSATADRR